MARSSSKLAELPGNRTHVIITSILGLMFAAEFRRFQQWIDKLSRKNQEASNLPNPGLFMHAGEVYRPSWMGPGKHKTSSLHVSLWEEGYVMSRDMTKVANDRKFVAQCLYALIDDCETLQDIRDALPEPVVPLTPEAFGLSTYSRGREAAYTIEGNERAQKQYRRMLPTIELYAASRMFY